MCDDERLSAYRRKRASVGSPSVEELPGDGFESIWSWVICHAEYCACLHEREASSNARIFRSTRRASTPFLPNLSDKVQHRHVSWSEVEGAQGRNPCWFCSSMHRLAFEKPSPLTTALTTAVASFISVAAQHVHDCGAGRKWRPREAEPIQRSPK